MIILTPHIELSIAKTKKFAVLYNKDLKKKLGDDKGKLYNKQCLKPTYLRTTEALIRMFYTHLVRLERCQVMPDQGELTFRTNNQAISNVMGWKDRSTGWRHITMLINSGIITRKVWNGTNGSYAIEINPECLEVAPCPEYDKMIAQNYMLKTGKETLTDADYLEIWKISKPSFSVFKNGIVASCNLKESNKKINSNIKMKSESELEKLIKSAETRIKDAGVNFSYSDNLPVAPTSQKTQEHQRKTPIVPHSNPQDTAGAQKNKNGSSAAKIGLLVICAWNFAKSALWNSASFCESDVARAQHWIQEYFSRATDGNSTTNQIRFTIFCERIMQARRYKLKSPERFIPNPAWWFDPHFEKGFRGTAAWFETMILQRQQNTEYYSNSKMLAQFYRIYSQNPTFDNYNKAIKILHRKHDKQLLELFNLIVENQKAFTPELFEEYRQKFVA